MSSIRLFISLVGPDPRPTSSRLQSAPKVQRGPKRSNTRHFNDFGALVLFSDVSNLAYL